MEFILNFIKSRDQNHQVAVIMTVDLSDVLNFLIYYGIYTLVLIVNDSLSYIFFRGKLLCRSFGIGFTGIFVFNPAEPVRKIIKNFIIYTILISVWIIFAHEY